MTRSTSRNDWGAVPLVQEALALEISSRNSRVAALQKCWDRLRARLDLIRDQRGADMADLPCGAWRVALPRLQGQPGPSADRNLTLPSFKSDRARGTAMKRLPDIGPGGGWSELARNICPPPKSEKCEALGAQKGRDDDYGIEITRIIQIPDVGEYGRGPP